MEPSVEEPLLTARELCIGYSSRAFLPAISLTLRAGELWALVGRNGSGKSTLLRTLMGFLPAVSGDITWGRAGTASYVPQRGDADPIVPGRALDFVRGGIDSGWSFATPLYPRRRREHVERAMRDTDTTRLAEWPVAELSEGQRQRVILARALVSEPSLLVLDEPTSAMDAAAEAGIFALLDQLRRDRHLAIVIVSHQIPPLVRRASHVVLVDKDEGLLRLGTAPEVTALPEFIERYGDVRAVRSPQAAETSNG